jgi:RND family efflux transporter MFP subunit
MDADILAAEANMALARQRHVRAVELVGQGFTSPQTLEQAKAELDVAEQKLRQARSQSAVNTHELGLVKAQLNQRTLRSPFNGVVIERFVSPGERAEDKPLLRLAMLDPLRVELVMPATRWGSVSVGDKMPIVPELPAASAVTARVTHIDKIIDAASNTFRVRLSLPNPGNRLPAGARCRLDGAEGGVAAASPTPAMTAGAVKPAPAGAAVPMSSPASLSLPAGVKPVAPAHIRPPV